MNDKLTNLQEKVEEMKEDSLSVVIRQKRRRIPKNLSVSFLKPMYACMSCFPSCIAEIDVCEKSPRKERSK